MDCWDCKYIDVDESCDVIICKKGYDLLLSMEIPSECNDFNKSP